MPPAPLFHLIPNVASPTSPVRISLAALAAQYTPNMSLRPHISPRRRISPSVSSSGAALSPKHWLNSGLRYPMVSAGGHFTALPVPCLANTQLWSCCADSVLVSPIGSLQRDTVGRSTAEIVAAWSHLGSQMRQEGCQMVARLFWKQPGAQLKRRNTSTKQTQRGGEAAVSSGANPRKTLSCVNSRSTGTRKCMWDC
jgi:hypothetical protein